MDSNERPGDEKQKNQSITEDMQKHCDSLKALASQLANASTGMDDCYALGFLATDIITLEEQIKIIKDRVEGIRADT